MKLFSGSPAGRRLAENLRRVAKRLLPERIPGFAAGLYGELAGGAVDDFYREAAGRIVSLVGSGSVLDVGTGPGFLPIEIVRLSPDVRVTGIDLTPKMIVLARRNAEKSGVGQNLRFEVGDANRLRYDDRTFDAVVSTGAFHAWKNPLRVLGECHRVLKPDGMVWIYDPARIGGGGIRLAAGRLKGWNRLALLWGRWTSRVQTTPRDKLDNLLAQTPFARYRIEYDNGSVVLTLTK